MHLGIGGGAEQIVERCEPDPCRAVQQAVVLAVGVGVADDDVEDRRIEQAQNRRGRLGASPPDQLEARGKSRSTFRSVLLFRRDPERLTEVFLVKAADRAVRRHGPIISLHDQVRTPIRPTRLHRCARQADRGGQTHRQGLVLGSRRQAGDRSLEDVGAGLARRRQGDRTVDQHHRKLLLCAGQRQPHAFVARKERAGRQGVEDLHQAVVTERLAGGKAPRRRRKFALRPQGQGAGDVAAQLLQQAKVVRLRYAERPGHGVALGVLWQQAGEEGARLTTIESFGAPRKRD